MPRQNRVNPFGEVVAFPERGTIMGNRGVLHDGEGRIRRAWQVKRWLVCLLELMDTIEFEPQPDGMLLTMERKL